jgi:hypothetical protein
MSNNYCATGVFIVEAVVLPGYRVMSIIYSVIFIANQ